MSFSDIDISFITEPYAYEMMLQAQTNVMKDTPGVDVFTLHETPHTGNIYLYETKLKYDPEIVLKLSLEQLESTIRNAFVYYMNMMIPQCSVFLDHSSGIH